MDELYATCPRNSCERPCPDHQTLLRRAPLNPLNLYLQDASDDEVNEVMNDYGNAIKQLAAANIFPGDMLLKNFESPDMAGSCSTTMTRLSRWWIATLAHPATARRNGRDVGPTLVFGGTERYLPRVPLVFSGNARARAAFDAQHADLYDADFWIGQQNQIRDGVVEDFTPIRVRSVLAATTGA